MPGERLEDRQAHELAELPHPDSLAGRMRELRRSWCEFFREFRVAWRELLEMIREELRR